MAPPDSNDSTPSEPGRPDWEELTDLLYHIRVILRDALYTEPPALSSDLRDHFKSAWPDVDRAFEVVRKAIEKDGPNELLTAAGLTGKSLTLKALGLRRAFGKLTRGTSQGHRKRLVQFLGWGGTIVGSLSRAIPGAEVIKEFIECVRNDLFESETERP